MNETRASYPRQLLARLRDAYGHAIILDGHTGSPRRMKDHQVIIGTRHEATVHPLPFYTRG